MESELDAHEIPAAAPLTDGAPGVEYVTVRTAAQRIRAARGKPAVVLLYDYRARRSGSDLSDIARLATRCRERGVEFLAFHTNLLSEETAPLPDILRRAGAPFPPVQLYPWKAGLLAATMGELGIQVGQSWDKPLAAVLDRTGEVVWQAQGVSDWVTAEQAAMNVAQSARP